MGKIAAIGDVHGCLPALRELYARVRDWFGEEGGKLILLGDLVDRGPDSKGVLDWIIDFDEPHIELIVLKGNHEELMIESLDGIEGSKRVWLRHGGEETIKSFGSLGKIVPYAKWITENCKTHHQEDGLYFVHAGIEPDVPLEQQGDYARLWIRDRFLNWRKAFDQNVVVVHGHTPVYKVEVKDNRINLDTGCCFHDGILSAGLFINGVLDRIVQR